MESPEIKMLRFPGLESPGKGIGPGKPWNSKVVLISLDTVTELAGLFWIHWSTLIQPQVQPFGLVYCNAVTSKTDLVRALFDLMQPCL